MTQTPLVYILIPVHNRQTITLTCLETLQHHGDLERYKVVVIDDGSTDGTAEAIQISFPKVIILKGDSHLWWTGAINLGMEYAYQRGADYFIWLNDDTLPRNETLAKLIQHCRVAPKRIATAQCYADDLLTQPTYGGQLKYPLSIQLLATPLGKQVACDCMSGNLVCLPRSVVDDLSYPPADRLPHCRADIVYTLSAKRAGYDLQVLGDAVAIAALNPFDEGWVFSSIPMVSRWRQLGCLKSNIHPPNYWVYCHEVFGVIGPLLFLSVYIKLVAITLARWILPLDWVQQLKNMKDSALKPRLHSNSP